ncbi:hypothetical protein BGZ80_010108 [Entomortierella chlamydospora]|uniref:Uncharacterized protein n=1 Tax=Entomortierella chlamydospora TaxID=101097 RepID=A0A9P6T403_9FUNG|nr:hypothetical protein BGZ79_005491 [Entomortierella chlamydospora]KAG0023203.1 hypothetical protein BGZ80_010108 [Entomortierella chlamydospora]
MTVDDSEMQRLWKLTNELTAQLVFNRNAALELKQQLIDLQGKASGRPPIISAFGYQDRSDHSLRIENERLREENLQLQDQVREYERWMEYIMGKFRLQNFAMAQSRKESMQEAYKMAEQGGEAAMRLQEENTMLHTRISNLGAIARKAIHEEYYTTESLIESLEAENRGLREMLGVAEGGNGPVTGGLNFYNEDGVRLGANRVSFPSTGSGSYPASSGSDHEEPVTEHRQRRQHRQGQQQQQQSPSSPGQPDQNHSSAIKAPMPLSVQTGLRSPISSLGSPQSLPPLSSATSPTSPSWSSSTSTPSSVLGSPLFDASTDQFKSISPPLDGTGTQNDKKQRNHRGKITINTNLGSPKANKPDTH